MYDWINRIPELFSGNNTGIDYRTPPYVPSASGTATGSPSSTTTAGPASGSGPGADDNTRRWWEYLLGPAIIGTGTWMQARAQNRYNDRLQERAEMSDQIAREERARKEYYSSILLPSMLQGMGVRNPNLLQMAKARQQALPGYGAQQPQGQPAPSGGGGGGSVTLDNSDYNPNVWQGTMDPNDPRDRWGRQLI